MHLLRRLLRMTYRHWLYARANVRVRTRDRRGFVVDEYRGHNIYLNVGRDWLLRLISYDLSASLITPGVAPPAVFHDNRIGFIGVGVGGREQSNQPAATTLYANNDNAAAPYDYYYDVPPGPYPPTFLQDDTDVVVTGLEDPVVWSGTNLLDAKWQKPISLVTLPASPSTWVTYTTIFDVTDINSAHSDGGGGNPAEVYISEAALFPIEIVAGKVKEPTKTDCKTRAIAYEASPPITKTTALQLEIQWTLKL